MFSTNPHLLRGTNYHLSQVHAMFLKKLIYTRRNILLILLQILIPIISISLCYLSDKKAYKPLPALPIDLMQYSEAVIVLETKALTPNSLESKIAEQYKTMIISTHGTKYTFESTGPKSFEQYILSIEKQKVVDSQYLAAATISMGKITAWLNNQPLHTAPLSLNLVHNAMARWV